MQRERKSRRSRLICVGLVLATLIAYEQLRLNDFVYYDDDRYVIDNSHVGSGLTRESVSWAFTTSFFHNWHPLTWLSHMLDVELYGLNAAGHHLTNLLLHVLNTLLLLALLTHMTGRLWRSTFVAALFALHPLHVEAVAWISERKELLSTLLGLLSMWAYVGYARTGGVGRYLLSAAFLALALMSKPMLVTLPLVFLLLDYWPLQRTRFGRLDPALPLRCAQRSSGLLLLEKLPLLTLSACSSIVTLAVQDPGTWLPLQQRAANGLVSYVRYLGKTFWPSDLAVLYQHPYLPGGIPWEAWQVAGAGLLLGAISIGVLLRAQRERYLPVGWLWYLGTLVPVIGVAAQVGRQAMSDRYTYLPLIGLFILVTWGGADLLARGSLRRVPIRRMLSASVVGVLAVCMVCTWVQVRHWRDSVSLFQHALAVDPRNFSMHFNLGVVLAKEDRVDEAISHYRRALQLNPRYARAHSNLGSALRKQEKLEEAIHHYREALRIKPDLADAHSNLGVALRSQGQLDAALVHYRKALLIDPDFADAHNNLANLLLSQGRTEQAVRHYRRVLRIEPDHADAHNNLGTASESQGDLAGALRHYRRAVELKPDYARAYYNLGAALALKGEFEEAIAHYQQALEHEPGFARAHNNLGVALALSGRLDEAVEHYQLATHLNPELPDPYYNLGTQLLSMGKLEESIPLYEMALALNPDYATAHHNLGIALDAQGKLGDAIYHYREALRVIPGFADAHFKLGQALESQGKLDEAIDQYRQALELDPKHPDALKNLQVAFELKSKRQRTP